MDEPGFDNDIRINSAFYSTNIKSKGGAALIGEGPWTILTNQLIQADSTHYINLTFNIKFDLSQSTPGDQNYTKCGTILNNISTKGEGLLIEHY